VPLWEFGLPDHASIDAVDLAADRRVTWTGKIQHVRLDPAERPYAIWRLVPPLTGD
jgi:starch synthase (maltosyl-transferring)